MSYSGTLWATRKLQWIFFFLLKRDFIFYILQEKRGRISVEKKITIFNILFFQFPNTEKSEWKTSVAGLDKNHIVMYTQINAPDYIPALQPWCRNMNWAILEKSVFCRRSRVHLAVVLLRVKRGHLCVCWSSACGITAVTLLASARNTYIKSGRRSAVASRGWRTSANAFRTSQNPEVRI